VLPAKERPPIGAAFDRLQEAHRSLFTVMPTTPAGAAAWLRLIASPY